MRIPTAPRFATSFGESAGHRVSGQHLQEAEPWFTSELNRARNLRWLDDLNSSKLLRIAAVLETALVKLSPLLVVALCQEAVEVLLGPKGTGI